MPAAEAVGPSGGFLWLITRQRVARSALGSHKGGHLLSGEGSKHVPGVEALHLTQDQNCFRAMSRGRSRRELRDIKHFSCLSDWL